MYDDAIYYINAYYVCLLLLIWLYVGYVVSPFVFWLWLFVLASCYLLCLFRLFRLYIRRPGLRTKIPIIIIIIIMIISAVTYWYGSIGDMQLHGLVSLRPIRYGYGQSPY